MFNNMSIKQKLVFPLTFIIALFTISAALNVFTSWKQTDLTKTLNNQIIPHLFTIEDAYRDLYQTTSAIQALVLAQSKNSIEHHLFEYKDNAYKVLPRIRRSLVLSESNIMPASHRQNVNHLIALTEQWLDSYERFITLPSAQWPNTYANNSETFEAQFAAVRKQLNIVKDNLLTRQTELQQEIDTATHRGESILKLGTAIVIISSIAMVAFLINAIIKPINHIHTAMTQIASGEGDLCQRLTVSSKDELGLLAGSFNQFVSKIQHTVSEVVESSATLRNEMSHLQQLTTSIANSTNDQQQNSHTVAAAVHEMQMTSRTVSDNANDAASASQVANQELVKSNAILTQTGASIRSLATDIESASLVINTLDNDVSNIASVLDVIRGIAEQTNLLALNAAIEAARAGEQGRGFAVVADEVRSLASRTQQSTGEIHHMIEKLQAGAEQAVNVMKASKLSSEETILSSSQASDSLNHILDAIEKMNEMNTHIATAAHQQSAVSEEVSGNVQGIADSSASVVIVVSQAQDSLATFSHQCAQLDKLVGQFKV
ncbi:methyl-accepting chemotaxis protein [Vibrio sp. FNV 38]|nr:methyl-accepting chemotaxis protein [Vibrio sp. FNV 38]